MEVYIYDMLVKSKERLDRVKHLQETFELLRIYEMKLNPSKCASVVSVGQFLGFMVTQRGIEANPAQLKFILESPALASIKEVQDLTSLLVALGAIYISVYKPFKTILCYPQTGQPDRVE